MLYCYDFVRFGFVCSLCAMCGVTSLIHLRRSQNIPNSGAPPFIASSMPQRHDIHHVVRGILHVHVPGCSHSVLILACERSSQLEHQIRRRLLSGTVLGRRMRSRGTHVPQARFVCQLYAAVAERFDERDLRLGAEQVEHGQAFCKG